jgi:hypothetical protein
MQYRKHYRCVGEKGLNPELAPKIWDQITAEAICSLQDVQAIEQNCHCSHCEKAGVSRSLRLLPQDIGVKKFKINHGLKTGHPLQHVKFFDKKSLN